MGILSFGKAKKADPTKREVGFGVLEIYPYLFSSADDFFKEVKKECLEYLSEEEQDAILENFTMDARSFRAFVPERTFKRVEKAMANVEKRGGSPFKTFVVRVNSSNIIGAECWCNGRWATGCCGGPITTEEFSLAFRTGLIEANDPRLKDYFILSHVAARRSRWERERANDNSYAAIKEE